MKTIYLAGPMLGCTDEEVHGWRQKLMAQLTLDDVQFRNPALRSWDGTFEGGEQVVIADLNDVRESDILVANMWKVGVGTSIEIFVADALQKFTITIVPLDQPVSPWLYVASLVVSSLAEAVAAIREEL